MGNISGALRYYWLQRGWRAFPRLKYCSMFQDVVGMLSDIFVSLVLSYVLESLCFSL
jgi:hypothetical protein